MPWIFTSPRIGATRGAGDSRRPMPAARTAPSLHWSAPRNEIRKLKRKNGLLEPVTVHVRAGTYFLKRTFKLTAEDSGTANAPIVYRGLAQDRPLLIGGKPVAGFAPHKDSILVADVAAQGLKGIAFRQLFFDGRRQILARYPNFDPNNPYAGGWGYVDGKPVPMYRTCRENTNIAKYKAEGRPHIDSPRRRRGFIFPRYNWWNNIVRIPSIDREKRTITLAGDCSYAIRPGDRYYVQELFEELDAPGEWYLDRPPASSTSGRRRPLEGKPVFAPTLRTIIELARASAHVTSAASTSNAARAPPSSLTETTDCLIAGCAIRNVGDYNGSAVYVNGGIGNGVAGTIFPKSAARRRHQRRRPQDAQAGRQLRRQQLHPPRRRVLQAGRGHLTRRRRPPGVAQPDPRRAADGHHVQRQQPAH